MKSIKKQFWALVIYKTQTISIWKYICKLSI